ncbi:MAG: hypothetical protein ACOX5H_00030 [Bacillus licheniformis]
MYVEGRELLRRRQVLESTSRNGGFPGFMLDDFRIAEASIHVFHAAYKMEGTGQPGTIAFRIRNDPDKGVS